MYFYPADICVVVFSVLQQFNSVQSVGPPLGETLGLTLHNIRKVQCVGPPIMGERQNVHYSVLCVGSQSEETLRRTLHIDGGRNPFHSYGNKIRSTLQNLGICILN